MRRNPFSSWITITLLAVAGTAIADQSARPAEPTRPECRPFLAVPSPTTSATLAWEHRLSLAACRDVAVADPTSDPAEFPALIARLRRAAEPTLAVYRDALDRAPTPELQIRAAYGLGMTHVGTITRARGAVRGPDGMYGGATYGARQAYQAGLRAIDKLLVLERDAAIAAFAEVQRLAEVHPEAARATTVMTYVVQDARVQTQWLHTIDQPLPNVTRR